MKFYSHTLLILLSAFISSNFAYADSNICNVSLSGYGSSDWFYQNWEYGDAKRKDAEDVIRFLKGKGYTLCDPTSDCASAGARLRFEVHYGITSRANLRVDLGEDYKDVVVFGYFERLSSAMTPFSTPYERAKKYFFSSPEFPSCEKLKGWVGHPGRTVESDHATVATQLWGVGPDQGISDVKEIRHSGTRDIRSLALQEIDVIQKRAWSGKVHKIDGGVILNPVRRFSENRIQEILGTRRAELSAFITGAPTYRNLFSANFLKNGNDLGIFESIPWLHSTRKIAQDANGVFLKGRACILERKERRSAGSALGHVSALLGDGDIGIGADYGVTNYRRTATQLHVDLKNSMHAPNVIELSCDLNHLELAQEGKITFGDISSDLGNAVDFQWDSMEIAHDYSYKNALNVIEKYQEYGLLIPADTQGEVSSRR